MHIWRAAVGAALAALLAGCASGPPTSEPDTRTPTAAATPSAAASAAAGPPTETFADPAPEGTGPEPPQSPASQQPVVLLAGPSLGAPSISVGPGDARCLPVLFTEPLQEDVRVASVRVEPADGFTRDPSACDGGTPSCEGYVFAGGSGFCGVGLRWVPASQVDVGTVTLDFTATCRSREDALCAELDEPPGPDGTPVRFVKALQVLGDPDAGQVDPDGPVLQDAPTLAPGGVLDGEQPGGAPPPQDGDGTGGAGETGEGPTGGGAATTGTGDGDGDGESVGGEGAAEDLGRGLAPSGGA